MPQSNPHEGKFSSRNAEKFVLRLSEGLRDRISEEAKAHKRSMNSEFVDRIQGSLDADQERQLHHDIQKALAMKIRILECMITSHPDSLDGEEIQAWKRKAFELIQVDGS